MCDDKDESVIRSDTLLSFNTPKRNTHSLCLDYGKFRANLKIQHSEGFLAISQKELHKIGHILDRIAQNGAEA